MHHILGIFVVKILWFTKNLLYKKLRVKIFVDKFPFIMLDHTRTQNLVAFSLLYERPTI